MQTLETKLLIDPYTDEGSKASLPPYPGVVGNNRRQLHISVVSGYLDWIFLYINLSLSSTSARCRDL